MRKHLFILLEVLIVYILAFLAGYILNPHDPFSMKNMGINVYLFALIVVTLFHGIWYGLIGVFILYLLLYYYYPQVNYSFFLVHVLVVLICGVFYFFYNRKLEALSEEKYFLNDRFNSLAKNFYLLKISYENLERNYLLKPFSIRDLLKEIRSYVLFDFDKSVSRLFSLIVDTFSIEEGSLYIKKGNNFKQVQFVGYPSELDYSDQLVKTALEKKEIVVVSDLHSDKKAGSIAVIPVVDNRGEIVSILSIKKMPFVKFNMDNILTISLLLSYFFDDVYIKDKLKPSDASFCDFDFHKELYKLANIRKNHKKESTVVIIEITNPEIKEEIKQIIDRRARSTDIYCMDRLILVILPLTSVSGAESYVSRLKTEIGFSYPSEYVDSINFSIIPVRKTYEQTLKDLQEFLE